MAAFKITETKSHIFQVPQTYSLAHTISGDLNREKGTLAWQFSIVFGDAVLNKQRWATGNVAVLEDNSRFIYYLIAKDSLYHQATYDTIEAALICMREHMRNHEIMKVAMPRIGCGVDRLQWSKVKDIINKVFASEFNTEILICNCDHSARITPKCQIVEVKGNIFSAPKDVSLVHSVSADFAMCQGIGLQFKCKFGKVNDLIKQNKHTGNVAVLKENDRFIYNLITKERNHERCTYVALYYALLAMREHMIENNVKKVAVPRMGCGLDRLDWLRVKKLLEYVFVDDNVEIITYFYDPPTVVTKSQTTAHGPDCRRYV